MGRELKRVALDFNWPNGRVWEGFLNPHWSRCMECDGDGETLAGKRLLDLVSLLLLSGSDSIKGRCHPYFEDAPLHRTMGKVCGPDMMELTKGLVGRSPSGFGHDSLDQWSVYKKIKKAAGVPESWGVCPACNGEGVPKENFDAYKSWEPMEPPAGEGYQIWETVSEGSPISPVFKTPEELARWMDGRDGSYESWLKFINGPGWAVSMVIDENGIHTGADAAL